MADVNIKEPRMSDNFISDKSRNEDSSQRGGTGKKNDRDKPNRMQLYQPRQGMSIKRTEQQGGKSWRMGSAENRHQNRHVDNSNLDTSSEITSKMKDLSMDQNHLRENVNIRNNQCQKEMKMLTVKTDLDDVVDLTVSPLRSDEKKKIKKPEQQIYIPKAATVPDQTIERIDWAEAAAAELALEEQLIIPKPQQPEKVDTKPKNKKKPKRYGKEREKNAMNNSSHVDDHRDVRQASEPRSLPQYRRGGRDTKSMEKPPPGRKAAGSTKVDLESMPPRFRKKFLEEKGLSFSAVGTTSEDYWDGGSMSFSSHGPPQWTQTVPAHRGLGRGRARTQNQHDVDRRQNDLRSLDNRYDHKAVDDRYKNVNGVAKYDSDLSARSGTYSVDTPSDDMRSTASSNLLSHRSGQSFSPEPKAVVSAPALFKNTSTPGKKLDWSEIVEKDDMSRSSSQNSLHQHSAPIQSLMPPRSRDRRGAYRRHDRSQSRDSGAGGGGGSGGGPSSRRRDTSRDRNKGHYRFHAGGSRENSRERKEWRRSNSRETSRERDWRRSASRETSHDRNDWRKGNRREEQQGSWRNAGGNSGGSAASSGSGPTAHAPSHAHNPAPMSTHAPRPAPGHSPGPNSGNYPTRGFINVPPAAQPSGQNHQQFQTGPPSRQLFDPSNPARPIIVNASSSRGPAPMQSFISKTSRSAPTLQQHQVHPQAMVPPHNMPHVSMSDPTMLGHAQKRSHYYGIAERNPRISVTVRDLESADIDLHAFLMFAYQKQATFESLWEKIEHARSFLKGMLRELLMRELKICQTENIEPTIWKITYYNLIEALKVFMREDPEKKEYYKEVYIAVLEEGFRYLEELIEALETKYNFKLDDYTSERGPIEKTPNVMLALNSAQKLLLCLGDMARYREQLSESSNYAKAKMYYTRALSLNPKNGRPYYQLGLVSFSSKRKLDAVYYYMRSLMAAHPQLSATESLLSLFEEFRKKYESVSRTRAAEEKAVTEKETKESACLRREIWIHPCARRRRVHRTTSTSTDSRRLDSDGEDLSAMSGVEINRLLTTSYLYVQGKIFSKVGMETFQEAGVQMLKEFRALLSQRPLPVTWVRMLQLAALNIFAIEHTKLKDPQLEPGSRSAVQENALIISLQMLSLMLERVLILLREQLAADIPHIHEDVQCLLPAIKVCCDWLLTHEAVWNPPPCCTDFCVGPPGDCWTRLAALVNFLEEYPFWKVTIVTKKKQGYEQVRLPEDSALSGFTPLILHEPDEIFTSPDTDMEAAQCCLRFRKVLFFATEFLPGIDPPVLKFQNQGDQLIYVSTVDSPGPSPANPMPDSDEDVIVESFSEGEGEDESDHSSVKPSPAAAEGTDTQWLLRRKEVLERKQQRQERQRRRVQKILAENGLSSELEIRPRYLVPDTNCFIDHLPKLKALAAYGTPAADTQFILHVPLIVVTELEGLARGGRDLRHLPLHIQAQTMTVAEDARDALAFLKPARVLPNVRCVTTSGRVINSFTSFAVEDDSDLNVTNDDKILATCLSLCRPVKDDVAVSKSGEPRRVYREVVLLTEDRNLRVKALSRELPVRDLLDFMEWLGLGPG